MIPNNAIREARHNMIFEFIFKLDNDDIIVHQQRNYQWVFNI